MALEKWLLVTDRQHPVLDPGRIMSEGCFIFMIYVITFGGCWARSISPPTPNFVLDS